MWHTLFFASIAFVTLAITPESRIELTGSRVNEKEYTAEVTFHLQPDELLMKDMLIFSSSLPQSKITSHAQQSLMSHYDTSFGRSLSGYQGTPAFTVTINHETVDQKLPAELHIGYMTTAMKDPEHVVLELPRFYGEKEPQQESLQQTDQEKNDQHEAGSSVTREEVSSFNKAKNSIKQLVTTTESPLIRLLLVFIMGILMSLTPCIYPMIPITVGILQTSASTSLFKNFLLALSYTIGQATMFAFLGLLAATGSAQFGMLLGNPFFVLFLVAFLTYMALSMFGLYEIYIPQFLQSHNANVQGGSYISAFTFGIISGSIASPCLSPGLLLLLSIVATLGNIFLGILMLFFFGLGTAFPLLIIGTFSSSLSVLPRAGMWMVEVKKLFGFMLISMCFYYLNALLPWHIILAMLAIFLFVMGVIYIMSIQSWYSNFHKNYCYGVGYLLLLASIVTGYQAVKTFFIEEDPGVVWHSSYEQAQQKALADNKLVLLDFGAQWCTICKEIEHTILHNPQVIHALSHIEVAHIDCTNPAASSCAQIQQDYHINGYPALILVDPKTGHEIKRWGAEVLELGVAGFIHDITACCY